MYRATVPLSNIYGRAMNDKLCKGLRVALKLKCGSQFTVGKARKRVRGGNEVSAPRTNMTIMSRGFFVAGREGCEDDSGDRSV